MEPRTFFSFVILLLFGVAFGLVAMSVSRPANHQPTWWFRNLEPGTRVFLCSLPFFMAAFCVWLAVTASFIVLFQLPPVFPWTALLIVLFPLGLIGLTITLGKPVILRNALILPAEQAPVQQPQPSPLKDRFRQHFKEVVLKEDLVVPPEHILEYLVACAEGTYLAEPFLPPVELLNLRQNPGDGVLLRQWEERWAGVREEAFKAVVQAFTNLIRLLPHMEAGPFQRPLYEAVPLGRLTEALIMPFRNLPFGMFNHIPYQFDTACAEAHGRMPPRMRRPDGRVTRPQDFKGPPAEAYKLFVSQSPFAHLYSLQVPFKLYDENRFAHTWVYAPAGKGKTTLLSALIWDDLKRMEQGECSIFIMDSQDNEKFLKSLVRLREFAPGGKWHDRLIYLEPDLQFTPALNPFDIGDISKLSQNERYEVQEAATTAISSLLQSLVPELTKKQDILYRAIIPALVVIPNATLDTMVELLTPGGYAKYSQEIARAPEHVSKWFQTHMRPRAKGEKQDQFADTIQELLYRIEGVMLDTLFARMLSHHENKLDLFEKLNEPNIVIVNTMQHRIHDKVEAFGRFFISKLLTAMRQRGSLTHPLPCFAYIDEATDYLRTDESIATLIFKSRKQNMGITIAHHVQSDLAPRVRDALKTARIICTPAEGKWAWNVHIDQLHAVVIPDLPEGKGFEKMDKMTPQEWQTVLREQREKWCVQYKRTDPTPVPPRQFGVR